MHPKLLFVLLFLLVAICFVGEKMKPAPPQKKTASRSPLAITHLTQAPPSPALKEHHR
jgi:hypothetical protein